MKRRGIEMKKEVTYVTVDSRNRITIPKKMAEGFAQSLERPSIYTIQIKDNGQIILDPIQEIPESERWLFESKNKYLLDELKKALKQKAEIEIDLDSMDQE
jgi:bifunctional DNA-binding transcriptional regulator/antitoxin component of YhaV-PrlF toxin-antitoxin module